MSSWISRAKFIMEGKSPKITQKDLIKVMGKTTRGAVGHYFTGRSRPTLDQLEDLAKYLGVSLSWLVSDNGDNAAVDDETLQMCLELVMMLKQIQINNFHLCQQLVWQLTCIEMPKMVKKLTRKALQIL